MTLLSFPTLPGLEFPIARSNLGFNVVKQESLSGNRARYAQRSLPVYRWEISFSVLRDIPVVTRTPFSDQTPFSGGSQFSQPGVGELQMLAGFYNSLQGATLPFLWTEPDDSSVTNQQFGVGDGVTTQFQLVRTWGGFTEPVYGSPVVTSLGVQGEAPLIPFSDTSTFSDGSEFDQPGVGPLQLPGTGYAVGPTGIVTFSGAPPKGKALTWTGTYQWLCRFDDDNLDFSRFMSQLWDLKKLTFSNELLP